MSISEIQIEAARIWGIKPEHLKSKSRAVEDVAPRRAAMVVCVSIFEYAMSTVDRAFDAAVGSTNHFMHAKKDFAFMDKAKYLQLIATCQKRKDKMCKLIASH